MIGKHLLACQALIEEPHRQSTAAVTASVSGAVFGIRRSPAGLRASALTWSDRASGPSFEYSYIDATMPAMPFPSEETVSAATADTAEATALAATEAGSALEFPLNDGEMAHLIRQHDWAATPLGHPSQWSASLRMVVRFMLANRFPHLLWWGPDYIQIYNDHYIPILGTKHPQQALGRPFRECWHEVYHILGPLVDTPFNGGPATWMVDIELIVRRHDFPEESHFIFAYSPVPDDTAPRGIGGVLPTAGRRHHAPVCKGHPVRAPLSAR